MIVDPLQVACRREQILPMALAAVPSGAGGPIGEVLMRTELAGA